MKHQVTKDQTIMQVNNDAKAPKKVNRFKPAIVKNAYKYLMMTLYMQKCTLC